MLSRPTTSSPLASRRREVVMPMKPAAPVTSIFTKLPRRMDQVILPQCSIRFLTLQHLGIFYKAVHTADSDVDQPGQSIAEALADQVELDETNDGAEGDTSKRSTFAGLQRHLGGQRGVAILFGQVGGQGFCRIVQQVALQGADDPVGDNLFMHCIVRPAGLSAIK